MFCSLRSELFIYYLYKLLKPTLSLTLVNESFLELLACKNASVTLNAKDLFFSHLASKKIGKTELILFKCI